MQHPGATFFIGIMSTALAATGCDGVLSEKLHQGNTDGGLISQVTQPACDKPGDNPAPTPADGHHHPGEDCLMCHHQGGLSPPFTFGGTAFLKSDGATAVAGATIHLIDAMGSDVRIVTATNGNFWSTDLVTYPVIAFASLCPTVTPMVTTIDATGGSCNASGCHTSGFRVHVP